MIALPGQSVNTLAGLFRLAAIGQVCKVFGQSLSLYSACPFGVEPVSSVLYLTRLPQ